MKGPWAQGLHKKVTGQLESKPRTHGPRATLSFKPRALGVLPHTASLARPPHTASQLWASLITLLPALGQPSPHTSSQGTAGQGPGQDGSGQGWRGWFFFIRGWLFSVRDSPQWFFLYVDGFVLYVDGFFLHVDGFRMSPSMASPPFPPHTSIYIHTTHVAQEDLDTAS